MTRRVAVVFDSEGLDVGNEGHGLIPLVGCALDSGAVETAHPLLIEDGVHGDDALEFLGDGGEVLLLQHATGAGCFERVGRDRVPATENDVVKRGEWNEVLDKRIASLFAGSKADVCHLADRTEWSDPGLAGREDSGDERRSDGSEAGGQNSELPGRGRDFTFCHGKRLSIREQ